jgi:predicted DNA-binding protein (MmcQ/YjbR family)
VDIDWIRKLCLSFPGATEQILWEVDLVFKVGGKMFAVARLEPAPVCLSFKCSDEDFVELTERQGIIPAPYIARAHWVALEFESAIARPELERLLRQAHALILAKLSQKKRNELLKPAARKPRPRSGRRRS